MRKLITLVLALACALGLVGCSPMDNVPSLETVKEYSAEDFNAHFKGVNREGLIEVWGEPAGSLTEENADMWDIDDESMVVIYWKDNGNFKDAGVSIKEGDSGECLELPDIETETVQYLDKTLNKSDLSAETLRWLEWFNGLSETEQLSVSFVPHDILELCGYVSTETSEISGPTD